MYKTVLSLLVTAFLLSACALSGSGPAPTTTPDANTVATEVSFLLAMTPASPTPPPPQAAAATAAPGATLTVTPTATALASPTPLTSTTPTANPNDPKGGKDPTWKDEFSNSGKSWGLYTNDSTSITGQKGKLVLSSLTTNGWHGWTLTSRKPQNFYMEGTFRTVSCAGGDLYGLVIRAPDYGSGQGYYFGVTCDGRFSFARWDGNGLATIYDLTAHPAILPGANQTNRLGILASGDSFKLYANDALMQDVPDSILQKGGHIGAFIAGYSAGFTVELSKIAYWDK